MWVGGWVLASVKWRIFEQSAVMALVPGGRRLLTKQTDPQKHASQFYHRERLSYGKILRKNNKNAPQKHARQFYLKLRCQSERFSFGVG